MPPELLGGRHRPAEDLLADVVDARHSKEEHSKEEPDAHLGMLCRLSRESLPLHDSNCRKQELIARERSVGQPNLKRELQALAHPQAPSVSLGKIFPVPKTTNSYKRLHGLTIAQENAIDLLVTGATDGETAETTGVNRVTVTKWRLYDPHFQAELNRRRKEVWGSAVDRPRTLLPRALDALEEELRTGNNRLRAAVAVLQLSGLDRGGPKKSGLDSYMVGSTDAQSIIDSRARARRPDPLQEILSDEPVTETERAAVLEELEHQLAD